MDYRIYKISVSFFLLFILTACNIQETPTLISPTITPAFQKPESSPTSSATPAGITIVPSTPSPESTSTITPSPVAALISNLVETCIITATAPLSYPGNLLVRKEDDLNTILMLNSSSMIPTTFFTGDFYRGIVSVSPFTGMMAWETDDGQWVFLSADGKEYRYLNLHPYYYITQWFPDNKVRLTTIVTSSNYYPARDDFYILDPETGDEEYYEISMVDYLTDSFDTLNRLYPPKYDPFLKIVGYVAHDLPKTRESIIFWDIENSREIWRMDGIGWNGYETPISWQLDGSHAATLISVDEDHYPAEIVEVSRDGQAKILTTLSQIYNSYQIIDLKWSPDERYLALILNKDILDPLGSNYLYILDTETGIIKNYCITPVYNLTWSPDSNFIAVIRFEQSFTMRKLDLIIVDVRTGQANICNDFSSILRWEP